MEECCHICGDIGDDDELITCYECKINCEHTYCMRNLLEKVPDYWRCEECESSSKPKPKPLPLPLEVKKRLTGKLLSKSSIDWEKKVEAGKTKYICVKEAIKLSSGEKKSQQPKSRLSISETTPMRTKTEPMKFSKEQPQQFKQFTESQRSLSSLQPSQASVNEHVHKEQLTEVKLPQTKEKSLMEKPKSDTPPVTISGGNKCATTEMGACNTENVNNNFLPHSGALWIGNFIVQDDLTHQKLNYQIQALPPSQVRTKVYQFSKQMPKVLHFQLVPLKKIWINLFRDYFPDRRDIGLYFVPSDGVRSEDYFSLLELISVKNFALRKQIDDVELLVFTSKLLSVDCQYLGGKYFLWGVFHRVRRDLDQGMIRDMDIDMAGGVDVGRIDIPVRREPLREKCVSFKGKSPDSKADNLGFKKNY